MNMLSTMADAHREWHCNTGIPIGTPGCPQDACHPIEDYYPEPVEGDGGIKCGHCQYHHWTVAEVRYCWKVSK